MRHVRENSSLNHLCQAQTCHGRGNGIERSLQRYCEPDSCTQMASVSDLQVHLSEPARADILVIDYSTHACISSPMLR